RSGGGYGVRSTELRAMSGASRPASGPPSGDASGAAGADPDGVSSTISSLLRDFEYQIITPRTMVPTAATTIRSAVWPAPPCPYFTTSGTMSRATRFMTLISGFRAGPAVSLNGSPTVSPMTAALWASDPLPPSWPSSMYFLALSQAPPELDRVLAISWPVRDRKSVV